MKIKLAYDDNDFYSALTHSSIQNFLEYYKTQTTDFNLSNIRWGYIDFAGMNLTNSHINGSIFYKCDFSGTILENVQCFNTRFIECDFNKAIGIDTHFLKCHFYDCRFIEANFVGLVGIQSVFKRCSFKGVYIATSQRAFHGAKLEGCSFVLAHIPRGWLGIGTPIQGKYLLLGTKPTKPEDVGDAKEQISQKLQEKQKTTNITIDDHT